MSLHNATLASKRAVSPIQLAVLVAALRVPDKMAATGSLVPIHQVVGPSLLDDFVITTMVMTGMSTDAHHN